MNGGYRLLLVCLLALSLPTGIEAQSGRRIPTADDGWAAVKDKRWGDALDVFAQAARTSPQDATLLVGAGYAAAMLGQMPDAQTWLERALKLNPRLTEASLLLGEVFYSMGRPADAVQAYEAAARFAPGNAVLTERLARWKQEVQLHSGFYQAQGAHFSILFEGPSDDVLARRVLEILEQSYYRIGSALTTYPSQPIHVVLYTKEKFHDITRSPQWSGGVFDGRIKIPVGGALEQTDDLQRVLDHELVHAIVATLAGPSIPTWVNEGLATALEPHGLADAAEQLRRDSTRVSPAQLAKGFRQLSGREVHAAYAQSAVAMKRMLDLRGAPAVVALLQALGRGLPFETAFQQTIYMRYEDFLAGLSY